MTDLNRSERESESHSEFIQPDSAIPREDLVAYLDGEASEDVSQTIEEAIRTDQQLRSDLRELDAAWTLLENLAESGQSIERTERTLAAIESDQIAQRPSDQKTTSVTAEPPGQRNRLFGALPDPASCLWAAIWAASIALSVMAGFSLTWREPSGESRMLIDDWPMIQQLEDYSRIESVEFLNELASEEAFRNDSE